MCGICGKLDFTDSPVDEDLLQRRSSGDSTPRSFSWGGGGPAEVHIASYIAGRIRSGVFNLAGKTSVDALPYIISRMDLLIINDSSPMHIAAATKTPLVVLFGPEDPTQALRSLYGAGTGGIWSSIMICPAGPAGTKGARL